jgi:hypothetical protein
LLNWPAARLTILSIGTTNDVVAPSGIMWTMRLWETLVRVTFGTFMGGLVLLLILLYSGVPIV